MQIWELQHMARKKKPVDAEFNTIDMDGDKPTQSPVANDQTATVATVVEDRLAGTGDVKDEIAEKLEQFEKLEKAAAELSAENQALKDKLAEYVQNAQKPKTNEFEKELAQLRDENDKYLMRISELTFENAKMHAELDELKKKISVAGQRQAQSQHRQAYTNVYRGALNGYKSWN